MAADTSWPTSGIRDDPPTSSTAFDLGRLDAGRADRPFQGRNGVGKRRPDHGLELAASQADLGLHRRQEHGDRHLGVRRQRLLGGHAVRAQPGHSRSAPRGSSGSSSARAGPRKPDTWASTASSKSMPPEPLDALGLAHEREPGLRPRQDRGVERPAAEVVDGDDLPRLDPLRGGVVPGRRLGLGQQQRGRPGQPGRAHGLAEEIGLVRPPVGRVGDGDARQVANPPGQSLRPRHGGAVATSARRPTRACLPAGWRSCRRNGA